QGGGHLTIGAGKVLNIQDDRLVNEAGGRVVLSGQLDSEQVQNEADADFITRADSRLNGRFENDGRAVLSGSVREVENRAEMVVGRDGGLVVDQVLENRSSGKVTVEGDLSLAGGAGPAL